MLKLLLDLGQQPGHKLFECLFKTFIDRPSPDLFDVNFMPSGNKYRLFKALLVFPVIVGSKPTMASLCGADAVC
jgi:hypothetical protein